jgi:hypothetical protein
MQSELKNQTLVAAELARQSGFGETYKALLSIARQIAVPENGEAPLHEHHRVGSSAIGEY